MRSRVQTATSRIYLPGSTSQCCLSKRQSRQFQSSQIRPSSQNKTDPEAIAKSFRSKFVEGRPLTRSQLLDANQLHLFSLALNRPQLYPSSCSSPMTDSPSSPAPAGDPSISTSAPVPGTPLPPAYHNAYFTPQQLPSALAADGSDTSYNPPSPFTRRMWAGGSIEWPGASKDRLLRVGDTVTDTTRFLSCEPKVIRKTGDAMLVVGVEKKYHNSKGELCVIDRRNWVFRKALDPTSPPKQVRRPPILSSDKLDELRKQYHNIAAPVRTFNQHPVTLFRFSALTFNGHRIHYDHPWAEGMEGHRTIVVHGPMNMINMLDMWRDAKSQHEGDVVFPKLINYRATSPVYAGEDYAIYMKNSGGESEMNLISDDGTMNMKGIITEF